MRHTDAMPLAHAAPATASPSDAESSPSTPDAPSHLGSMIAAGRAGTMASMVEQRVMGVVENMAYLETRCPHCSELHRVDLFGTGGGAQVSEALTLRLGYDVPLLAEVPIAIGTTCSRANPCDENASTRIGTIVNPPPMPSRPARSIPPPIVAVPITAHLSAFFQFL